MTCFTCRKSVEGPCLDRACAQERLRVILLRSYDGNEDKRMEAARALGNTYSV